MSKPFKIYKSSAGSGKTFTLVKEYLSIALATPQSDRYKYILAITFTNKAANEMKERIIDYLNGLQKKEIQDKGVITIQNLLCEELNLEREVLAVRAKNTLTHLLHHYSQFYISTIDKFLINVVRTFSNDLFLNSSFEVNMDTDALFDQAVQELISRAGEDKELTKVLTQFVETNSENDQSWHVENSIISNSKHLFDEKSLEYIKALKNIDIAAFLAFKKELQEKIHAFENKLISLGTNTLESLTHLDDSDFKGGKNGVKSYFRRLANQKFTPASNTLNKYRDESVFFKTNVDTSLEQEVCTAFDQAEELLQQVGEHEINKKVNQNIFSLALLNEVEKIINELKEDQNFVHISEFNKKIFEVVTNEPIPFIYERFGNRFNHIMIDEFQDTSVLQWYNLLPLLEHSLSQGFKNLVVGDTKQAIYRWRGGDVQQFAAMPSLTHKELLRDGEEKEQTLKRNAHEVVLKTNFRSSISVIDFNNDFFESVKPFMGEAISNIYNKHAQEINSENTGYVELKMLNKDVELEEMMQSAFIQIEDCLARGYDFQDIAIINRTNEQSQFAADFLNARDIPVVSNESFLLEKNQSIKLLVSALKFIHEPQKEQYQFQLINAAYLHSNSELDLYTLHLALKKSNQALNILKQLEINLDAESISQLSLYEKTEELANQLQIDVNDANVIQFFDIVHQFSTRRVNHLAEFLKYWEEKKSKISLNIPENLNAVQILSIHSSKGLEFPVVISPFCFSSDQFKNSKVWVENKKHSIPYSSLSTDSKLIEGGYEQEYQEELLAYNLENLNLLYVLFTRASEELFITSKQDKKASTVQTFQKIILQYLKNKGIEDQYIIGEKSKKEKEIRKDSSIKVSYTNSKWRDKIEIAYQDPDSRQKKAIPFEASFGIQVHYVLSRLNDKNELNSVIQQGLRDNLLAKKDEEAIKQHLTSLFEDKSISELLFNNDEVYNERELITEKGKIIRPDKIIKKNGEWSVIDFKTGQFEEVHEKQIREYIFTLNEIHPDVKGYLVYTEDAKIISV